MAAAPLAAWVRANVKYSYVLERIQPLEAEQSKLQKNLDKAVKRLTNLERTLSEVDAKVAGLRDKFERRTREAEKLKLELEKANDTITAAELLVSKLEGEHERWNTQVRA